MLPSLGFGLFLGLSNGQWVMAIFSGVTAIIFLVVLLVKKNRNPISENDQIHWGSRQIAIGNRKLARNSWFWSHEIRERIATSVLQDHARNIALLKAQKRTLGNLAVSQAPEGLSFFSGFAETEELVIDLVADGPHAFICGPTGSGKSQYLKLILNSLLETYSANQVQLVTVDFKGGATLNEFDSRALCSTTDLATNQSEVIEYLKQVLIERERQLCEAGKARIEDLPNCARIVVAIDELNAFLQTPKASEVLESIAARGRSLGVHLVTTSQSTSGISRSLMVNLGLRVAIGQIDQLDAAQLGFKPVTNKQIELDGMFEGQIITSRKRCVFSFPLISVMKITSENQPFSRKYLLT